jgi:hypothetical protein|tara:strand:- start:96 stop:398 length:303 start_codon:yes stop_codon:yes gene_type:complete
MYTERYLRDLYSFNEKRLGVQLGRLCVSANLPPSEIAKVLNVSRMTVYNWFRGGAVRSKNVDRIEVFMRLVEDNIQAEKLPVQSYKEAKLFIKDYMLGKL